MLGMRGLECVSHVPLEKLMLSQYGPEGEASQFINRFHSLVIHNVPSCVCVLCVCVGY